LNSQGATVRVVEQNWFIDYFETKAEGEKEKDSFMI